MSDAALREARRQLAAYPSDFELRARVRAMERRAGEPLAFSADRARPDHHPDLVQVDSLDQPDLSYEFHLLGAWMHQPTGRVLWGEDSGCSCPSPWENEHVQFDGETLDTSLTELTPMSLAAFETQVEGFPAPIDERRGFIDKVKAAWRAGLGGDA